MSVSEPAVSTASAASALQVSPQYARRLVQQGYLTAQRAVSGKSTNAHAINISSLPLHARRRLFGQTAAELQAEELPPAIVEWTSTSSRYGAVAKESLKRRGG